MNVLNTGLAAQPAPAPAPAPTQAPADDMFGAALSELLGVDASQFDEVRFESLPPMIGGFECTELDVKGRETGKGPRLFIEIKTKVLEVTASPTATSPEDMQKLLGKTHSESFVIDPADKNSVDAGIGRFKAWMVDTGWTGTLTLQELKNGAIAGHKFNGQIKHRANAKDASRPFVNLNPVVAKASAQVAV